MGHQHVEGPRTVVAEAPARAVLAEVAELVLSRSPGLDPVVLRGDLEPSTATWHGLFVTRDDDGRLTGAACARIAEGMPPGTAMGVLAVRADAEGQGLASALRAALLAALPKGTTRLVGCLRDGATRPLAVVEHWGGTVLQRSVTTSCRLTGEEPAAVAGVAFEAADALVFDDEPAVEEALRASQTNPEAEQGLLLTLAGLRAHPTPGQRPVAVLARVHGRPAALSFAVADGDHLHVVYTGVAPAFRGHGLARATKAHLHVRAHGLGVRVALTDNEEGNAGIRRVNDSLGYTPHSAWLWLATPVDPSR